MRRIPGSSECTSVENDVAMITTPRRNLRATIDATLTELPHPCAPHPGPAPRAGEGERYGMSLCSSPNHLVRAHENRLRNGKPEGFGGLEIDDEFELGRLLDRQVAWLGAFEELVDVTS